MAGEGNKATIGEVPNCRGGRVTVVVWARYRGREGQNSEEEFYVVGGAGADEEAFGFCVARSTVIILETHIRYFRYVHSTTLYKRM